MKHLWTSLTNIGVDRQHDSRESRHIAFLNTLVLMVLVLIVQNIAVAAFVYAAPLLLIVAFVGHLCFIALTLVWNLRRQHLVARIWFALSATLFLSLYSIMMGHDSYWEFFLVVCVYVQFHIFPESERRWMTAVVLTCSLCFLGVHFLVPATGILSDSPGAFVRAVTNFNLVGILLGSVCMGVVGYVVVNRSERNLVVAYERSEQAFKELKSVQARLIQQEKMASLGALTAGIAHEIKNPLNFINNFSEVNEELTRDLGEALDKGDLKEIRALLADLEQNERMINEHGKRADGIVHAMIQHASAGSNQREATALNALVADHIDLAYHGKRAQHPDFSVDLQRDLGADVGTVELVPKDIGRVLLNLLGNAFDAVRERAASVNGQYAGGDPGQ